MKCSQSLGPSLSFKLNAEPGDLEDQVCVCGSIATRTCRLNSPLARITRHLWNCLRASKD